MNKIKIISLILAIIAVLNIFLFAFRVITPLFFWIIIAVLGFLAYYVLPKFK